MGRAFEYRKNRKMKRWAAMSKTFSRLGKEIRLAIKEGGPYIEGNSRLRAAVQNARAANMPKENVDRAIKEAIEKSNEELKELVYEGFGPHGIAFVVETATDNSNRTVMNLRTYFSRAGGSLANSGSCDFLFDRKCLFRVKSSGNINLEEMELELIDFEVDEVIADGDEIIIYGPFTAYKSVQTWLEEKGLEVVSSELVRVPVDNKELTPEQIADIEKLIEKIEEDDDVQALYHNMKEEEGEEE